MVRLYTCNACAKGQHKKCERGHPAPPGHYGGSRCLCPCDGDPLWREKLEREATEYLKLLWRQEK